MCGKLEGRFAAFSELSNFCYFWSAQPSKSEHCVKRENASPFDSVIDYLAGNIKNTFSSLQSANWAILNISYNVLSTYNLLPPSIRIRYTLKLLFIFWHRNIINWNFLNTFLHYTHLKRETWLTFNNTFCTQATLKDA